MQSEEEANNSNWLNEYAANRNSQSGEDGILAKILEILGVSAGWCVEFGAWDGQHLSNTYDLIQNKGFSAVLIEGSESRHSELARNFANNPSVVPVHAFVGFDDETGLDAILAKTEIPTDFEVLSIDIDGNDYHVWKAVTRYTPKVVVIEYNPTIPSNIDFSQLPDMSVNQGSSILAHKNLGITKGYELVCITANNCIFVRADLYDLFNIADNSIDSLRPDDSLVTYLFSGFDGTLFIRGCTKLPWHGFMIREGSLQQVPKWLRQFPSNYGPIKKLLSRPYRSWRKRRS